MKNLTLAVAAVVVFLLLAVLSSSLYVVYETQQVVITQFGKPVAEPVTTPGLKMKVPFV
jgi:modulator of FtsH protease HflC